MAAHTPCLPSLSQSTNAPVSLFSALPDITTLLHRNPERGAVQRLRERYVEGAAEVWQTHTHTHTYARAHRTLTELITDLINLSV